MASSTTSAISKEWMAGACAALGIDPQTPSEDVLATISLLSDLRAAARRMSSGRPMESLIRSLTEAVREGAGSSGRLGHIGSEQADGLAKQGAAFDEMMVALAGLNESGVSAQRFSPEATEPLGGPPHGYESTTAAYVRYVSPERYAKFRPEVQQWYRPYWVASEQTAASVASTASLASPSSGKPFSPPESCDSPELCAVNRACAGQYGSKASCHSDCADLGSGVQEGSQEGAATRADQEVYRGIADRYVSDVARLQGVAIEWPKCRDIARIEDMSGEGYLRVTLDNDNDVCVEVYDQDRKRFASVEFCNPGAGGGGQSRHTRAALIGVMVAMERDTKDNARKAHPRFGATTQEAN